MSRKSIKHLKNLAPGEVLSLLKSDIWEVSEKLDGSNIEFGFDEKGFYTSREEFGGDRYYSVDDYPFGLASEFGIVCHAILEQNKDKFIAAGMKEGDKINCEALIGFCPNTIPYGNDEIVYLSSETIDINALPVIKNETASVRVPDFDGSGDIKYKTKDVCVSTGVNVIHFIDITKTPMYTLISSLVRDLEYKDLNGLTIIEMAGTDKRSFKREYWKSFSLQKYDIDWSREHVTDAAKVAADHSFDMLYQKLKLNLKSVSRTTEGFVIKAGNVTCKVINFNFMHMKNNKWKSSEVFCYGKDSLARKLKLFLDELPDDTELEHIDAVLNDYSYAAELEYSEFLDRKRKSYLAEWDERMYNYFMHTLINIQNKLSVSKTYDEFKTLIKD